MEADLYGQAALFTGPPTPLALTVARRLGNAGMKLAFRTAWPLIVALIGTLPIVTSRRAFTNGNSPIPAAVQAGVGALLVAAFTVAWLRFREPARAWWKRYMEEGQQAARDRQAARQGTK